MGFIPISDDSEFSLANIPLGAIVVGSDQAPRCVTRVGDTIIDLSILEEAGLFEDVSDLKANTFSEPTLNKFLEHPKRVWTCFRKCLQRILSGEDPVLKENPALQKASFYDSNADEVDMELPITIGDYTDFYSSREHATNVGIMFRGKENALQPNWLSLPVGYHGRSSTISVTGHTFKRPYGQLQKDPNDPKQGSVYGPSKLLDFELEVAAVVGGPPNIGHSLTLQEAKDRIYGFMLMNDWSARDIQKWEYIPLGPFTSKNFATTVSAWIVSAEALVQAPTSSISQEDPAPLEYLVDPEYSSYDIDLTVTIQSPRQENPHVVCRSNFRNMYWNAAQQLCHHSVSGCVMRAGDLLGSGTISGTREDSFGSMLELSWKGSREVPVGDEARKFLQDGDTVNMTGVCRRKEGLVGFGECKATILPADFSLKTSSYGINRYRDFKLFSYWRSSSTWRVRAALEAKQIAYDCEFVDLIQGENRALQTSGRNIMKQVPVLEFFDAEEERRITLTQSLAIIQFLEDIFPDRPSVIPRHPLEKSKSLQIVEIINSGTQPLQNIFWLRSIHDDCESFEPERAAKLSIEKGLEAVELLVSQSHRHGPFTSGTFSPSISDMFVTPQIYNALRYKVDVESSFPLLWSIYQHCLGHKWFSRTHPEKQPDRPSES